MTDHSTLRRLAVAATPPGPEWNAERIWADPDFSREDAAFIAACRSAVPALIEENEALRVRAEAAEARVKEIAAANAALLPEETTNE